MKALVSLLFLPLIAWAEPATVVRATDLKAEPATDAATVKQLAENTRVEALERKGGWTRVKAGSAEGWVKMLVLRYSGASDAKRGDTGLTQAINVARTGSSGTQVTTGVRGLDEEQLAKARPNPAELAKLDGFAADRASATSFAEAGKLSATSVPYPKP